MSSKKRESSGKEKGSRKKALIVEGPDGEHYKPVKKAQKEKVFVVANPDTNSPTREIPVDDPVAVKYTKLSVAELKEWLKANNGFVTGVKDELVTRCIDGELNGRLPLCERCGKGRLHFDSEVALYKCQGYFDDQVKMRITCNFVEPQVKRLEWKNPENVVEDESPQKASGDGDHPPALELTSDVIAQLKGESNKETAGNLVKYCRETLKLSLPSDDKRARMDVGGFLMSTRTADGEHDFAKILQLVKEKFPSKTASDGTKSNQGGPKAKVEENESIAALLDELAMYERKKGGENHQFKVRALKKAAIAVRGVDHEITDGLALGKPGKNKVEGIGKSTAKNIQDFLDSGKTSLAYLDELKREVGE